MKRFFIFIFFVNIITGLYPVDRIITWDKKTLSGPKIIFDGMKMFFDGDRNEIDLNKVSYIQFNFNEQNGGKDKDVTDELPIGELKKRAEYMIKRYPDAKSLVLCDDGIQRLNKDGSRYSMSHYSVMIMNEKELDKSLLAFYEIPGDTTNRILFARSISPDGTILYLAPDDIKYTEPKQGLEYFSGRRDAKIMTASIPGVKVGSILEFKYETVEASFEDPKQYYTQWYFGGTDPVYQSSVKVVVPADMEYYFASRNMGTKGIKPVISNTDGYRTYAFLRGENPPVINEPQGPPDGSIIPFIKGSSFKNQDYLSSWLSKMMKERMILDDTIKAMVDSIITKANAKTEDEKIAVLYRFMQEYIRYLSIKTSLSSGFTGHPATETFYNKYGDCIDKSILFATILGYIGVEAYPVIVMTNDETQPLYGDLGLTSGNHAINEIRLKNNGRIIYLDSTGISYRYPYFRTDDHGIKAWNPLLNTVRTIDPPDIRYNTQEYIITVNLDIDGNGSIKENNIYTGQMDSGMREYFLSLNDIQKKSLFRNMVSDSYTGSVLKNFNNSSPMDYDNNFSLEYEYDATGVAGKSGNFLIFNLPVKYGFSYTNTKERKFDLVFETTYAEKNTVEIKLPEGFGVVALPEPVTIKNGIIEYEGSYAYKDGKIIYKDYYKRFKKVVSPGEYKKFRNDVLKIDDFTNIPLIIEKK